MLWERRNRSHLILSATANSPSLDARQIPRPARKNAGLRDDSLEAEPPVERRGSSAGRGGWVVAILGVDFQAGAADAHFDVAIGGSGRGAGSVADCVLVARDRKSVV